jgi:hypothetical protein
VHIGDSVTLKLVLAAPHVILRLPLRKAPLGQGPAPPVTGTVKTMPFSVELIMLPIKYDVPPLYTLPVENWRE